jgi:serine protease
MKCWKLSPLVAAAALLSACSEQPVATAPELNPSFSVSANDTRGRYLVVFRSSSSIPAKFSDDVAKLGGRVDGTMSTVGAAVISNLTSAAAAQLGRSAGVQSVDLDPTFKLNPQRSIAADVAATDIKADLSSPTAPNTAGFYVYQWNMRQIGAPAAWAAGRLGSSSVRVGIIDTGIDEGNPAVSSRRNIDLEGRVDRTMSRSFMPVEDTVVQRLFPGAPLYTDLDGHGTNVASQVASNAFNLAGVTSRATLVSLKACTILPPDTASDPGYCSTAAVFQAIAYAIENGIDVVNMSLGGGFMKRDCQGCTSIFNRVIGLAQKSGVTIVVAAGNSAIDLDHDKSFYNAYCSVPGLICVGATGATSSGASLTGPFLNPDAPALYSNFGRSALSVVAPGGNYSLNEAGTAIVGISYIWSLCPRRTAGYFDETAGFSKAYGTCSLFGYVGTSQASPHTAGLAALLVELYGRDPGAIQRAIERSADQPGGSAVDPRYGHGRINVARALGL